MTKLETLLSEARFEQVELNVDKASKFFIADWGPGSGAEHYVASATIEARMAAVSATAGDETEPQSSCCAPSFCACVARQRRVASDAYEDLRIRRTPRALIRPRGGPHSGGARPHLGWHL